MRSWPKAVGTYRSRSVTTLADPTRFDYLFPQLQNNATNLLPQDPSTVTHLVQLGRAMRDTAPDDGSNSPIPAAYTYLGQFIDHDITLETASASLPDLLNLALTPMPLQQVRDTLFNMRTATFDLDSVYGIPAPRAGQKMKIGTVSPTNNPNIPFQRPAAKSDANDLPRDVRSADPRMDRAAQIGDPRNDENTIVAQLHLAFLLAHNKLVDEGKTFAEARTLLRRHYQWMVLEDFLKQVCDRKIFDRVLKKGPQFYKPMEEPFFLPLEFAVAAYRFGHSMVRRDRLQRELNTAGPPAFPATLGLLFTFTHRLVNSAYRTRRTPTHFQKIGLLHRSCSTCASARNPSIFGSKMKSW